MAAAAPAPLYLVYADGHRPGAKRPRLDAASHPDSQAAPQGCAGLSGMVCHAGPLAFGHAGRRPLRRCRLDTPTAGHSPGYLAVLLFAALFHLLLAVVGMWPGAMLLLFKFGAFLAWAVFVIAHQFLQIIINVVVINDFALAQHVTQHLHLGHIQRAIAVRLGPLHQLIDHRNRIFMRAQMFQPIPNHQQLLVGIQCPALLPFTAVKFKKELPLIPPHTFPQHNSISHCFNYTAFGGTVAPSAAASPREYKAR